MGAPSPWLRRIALAAAALLVLLLAGGAWGLVRLRSGPGPLSGDVPVAGPAGPIEVLVDSMGIPHVWAGSVSDALFAQGFLHATDRLWQMDQFRRVATGRLAEIFGEPAVATDRFLRTLGLGRAAERGIAELCDACRSGLEAYAAGVNAALASWRGPLPPEFVLLRARPQPWTVADALALEKIMAWDLADYDIGLLLADAQRRGGDALLDAVRPRYPEGGTTILGDERAPGATPPAGAGSPGGAPPSAAVALPLAAGLVASARVPEGARPFLAAASALSASNAWVVGGARSRSGKPLLANDMHLALNAPTLFYLMGLHAPGLDVVGLSIPGSAGIIAGHTPAVAWGFSNAGIDDVDFFVERVDPADTTRYLVPGGSEPFVVRDERIVVRGRDEPLALRVRETRHGPIMSDVDARAGGELLALRWAGHDPSSTFEAVLGMDRAGSAAQLVEALRLFRDPHQNVVFADTAGAYGYWMAGRVPLRRSGRPPLLPVPGWTGDHDWMGDLPFDEHPHVLGPSRGFVVTANHRPTTGAVSDLLTDGGWAPPHRAERITERIEAEPLHDAASMHDIQRDVVSVFALRHRDAAAAAFREAGEAAIADSLLAWDGSAAVGRREPVLFWTWFELLRFRLARDLYGGPPGYLPMTVAGRRLEAGRVGPALLAGVVPEAVADARDYTWGQANVLRLDHPLAALPVAGRLLGFGREGIARRGDPFTVDVASFTGRFPPFVVRHGASQRHVVDLADPDGPGGFVLPGGQSGYPAGAHSWDQLPLWLEGGLVPLPLDRSRVEARTATRFRLVPR